MSDETKVVDSESTPNKETNELYNLKQEMNRKLENQNAQLAALLQEIRANTNKPTGPEQVQKKVSVFDDEEAYARSIEERATAKIKAELQAQQVSQTRHQSVIQSIVSEFPEATDDSSPLMIRAKELYASYGDEDRATPLAMKAAVTSAAAELGIRPKSKRSNTQSSGDNFTLGGGHSSGSRTGGNNRQADLDAKTEAFAQIMGLDTSKKEVRERLKSRTNRDYTRYGQ